MRGIPSEVDRIDRIDALQVAEQACRFDPWFFVKNFVFTMDEHDLVDPIKHFPDYKYARKITQGWHTHNKVAVVKSRQIMLSWLMVALHFWLAFFHKSVLEFFISEKEEKADDLLDRARIIYDNLPEPWKIANPVEQKYCQMMFPKMKSKIRALPSGTDQIRMYTSSAILFDEAAFQANQRANFIAAYPSASRGGKITAISTVNGPNYFSQICTDNSVGTRGVDKSYMKKTWIGLQSYREQLNPKNGFFVIDVGVEELVSGEIKQRKLRGHPAKKYREDFMKQYLEGLDDQGIQQEVYRNFYVVKGEKVYSRYKDDIYARKLMYNQYRPLLCSWDFGYHWPAVVFAQYDDSVRTLYVLGEYMGHDIEIFDFVPEVQQFMEERWPGVTEFEHFCDPSGVRVSDTSMKSSIDVLCDNRIYPSYCQSSVNEGIDIVRDLMKDRQFYIDHSCEVLRRGLIGGIVYEETKEGRPESEMPKKDGFYEHLHDSLRYLVVNKLNLFKTPKPTKPEKPFKMPMFHLGIESERSQHWAYGN